MSPFKHVTVSERSRNEEMTNHELKSLDIVSSISLASVCEWVSVSVCMSLCLCVSVSLCLYLCLNYKPIRIGFQVRTRCENHESSLYVSSNRVYRAVTVFVVRKSWRRSSPVQREEAVVVAVGRRGQRRGRLLRWLWLAREKARADSPRRARRSRRHV